MTVFLNASRDGKSDKNRGGGGILTQFWAKSGKSHHIFGAEFRVVKALAERIESSRTLSTKSGQSLHDTLGVLLHDN